MCGDNGQGKTNMLEGMALFSGVRSFRGAHNNQMIAHDKKFARLHMGFFSEKREQTADMTVTPEARLVVLNGVKQAAASALIGVLSTVVFSPDRMSLITGGAVERRRFIDSAISQSLPRFAQTLYSYNKAIGQRNALLKSIAAGGSSEALLDVWDRSAAGYAAEIAIKRADFCSQLSLAAGRVYEGISSGKEPLRTKYVCSYYKDGETNDAIAERFLSMLKDSRRVDIANGYTTKGPHRDDINIYLSDKDIRIYGSQGQKRSAVLAMKLAEAELLSQMIGEQPIALLDDVMSELDRTRQEYLLNKLDGWQVFITCCDPSPLQLLDKGSVFYMESGSLSDYT